MTRQRRALGSAEANGFLMAPGFYDRAQGNLS